MTDVHIISNEVNCYFAALLLAARGFRTAIEGRPGETTEIEVFGDRTTVHIHTTDQLDAAERIAIVAAEGEDLRTGIHTALASGQPDLFIVIGGGAAGVIESIEVAQDAGIDPGRVLNVSAFIWGGRLGAPVVLNSEKLGLLAAFLGDADEHVRSLAERAAPTLHLTEPLAVALSSLNALIHPVPMVLGATEVDRASDSRFFIDTFGDAVCRVAAQLDRERLTIGRALGLELPSFEAMLREYYSSEGIGGSDLCTLVNTFHAYQSQIIPHSFEHRYLSHELANNLSPMSELAKLLSLATPVLNSLLDLGTVLAGRDLREGSNDVASKLLQLRS